MKKYRKKPLEVEAVQWDGQEVNMWDILHDKMGMQSLTDFCYGKHIGNDLYELKINTLEGQMICGVGDYIIKGIKGEFYPIRFDIFKESYEEIH